MFRQIARLSAEALDRVSYPITLVRLSVFDWLTGPPSETETDRAFREQSEQLREAFPVVDFDDPNRHAREAQAN